MPKFKVTKTIWRAKGEPGFKVHEIEAERFFLSGNGYLTFFNATDDSNPVAAFSDFDFVVKVKED